MFVLIWATLLFCLRRTAANTDAPMGVEHCVDSLCITLSKEEITAEAGLCVVIPCSFTSTNKSANITFLWHKCKLSKGTCEDSHIIFHSDKKDNVKFKGRVLPLEPDVTRGNCSIIINDLTESDSRSYLLKVVDSTKISPSIKSVSVKVLTQKPTVTVPSLTEGQLTTLTCTAPGLCSGSAPQITWTWRGAGETDRHITGNRTAFKTENLTAVAQRHSSTLTFNTSAKHHNTDVTCKVSFTNGITTEETVTLSVTDAKDVQIPENYSVKEDAKAPVHEGDARHVSDVSTISSSTVSVKAPTTGQCVGSSCITDRRNENKQDDPLFSFLIIFIKPEVIIAFFIGILLSSAICCLLRKCCRNKRKHSGNTAETLEMVTTQAVPLSGVGQAAENDGIFDQEAAEGGRSDGDGEPRDVEYSAINLSLLKRKSLDSGAEETPETEYAEIKTKEDDVRQDNGGEDSEGKEVMMGEDEETEPCMSAGGEEDEEGREDMAVYSSVNDITSETRGSLND